MVIFQTCQTKTINYFRLNILNKIKASLKANLPFVAYNKPNEKKVYAFFQKDDTLHITKDYREKGFVFAPFDDEGDSILIPAAFSDFIIEEKPKKNHELKTVSNVDESSKTSHIEIVKKGIKAIEDKSFKKVVLSRKEKLVDTSIDPILVFEKLLNTYNNAFVYIWYHPKVGFWLGATPETLLRIKGSCFETMSLAGTQVYEKDKTVIWKAKEIDEQQLVTDYVLQKLKTVCKSVYASEVETIKAGSLLHLKTTIKGELIDNTSKLINVLHPTPAVCGFPKNDSKEFILKNEGYNRSFYTGFLGELNMPNSELFVNLRCMEIEKEVVNIYVGGGITIASNPEKEWEETVSKTNTMKRVL